MVKSALTCFDSKEETGILGLLLMLLGTHSRYLSKRLKGTFGVTVRRWLEVSRYIWEDFLEEVNFSQKAKLALVRLKSKRKRGHEK